MGNSQALFQIGSVSVYLVDWTRDALDETPPCPRHVCFELDKLMDAAGPPHSESARDVPDPGVSCQLFLRSGSLQAR